MWLGAAWFGTTLTFLIFYKRLEKTLHLGVYLKFLMEAPAGFSKTLVMIEPQPRSFLPGSFLIEERPLSSPFYQISLQVF